MNRITTDDPLTEKSLQAMYRSYCEVVPLPHGFDQWLANEIGIGELYDYEDQIYLRPQI